MAAPSMPTFSLSSQPNANGWLSQPITVGVMCDPGSTATPAVLGPFGDQPPGGVVTASCTDAAGEVSTGETSLPGIDLADPSIQFQLSSAPDASGWFTRTPTVSYVCADAGSGIASCPAQERLPDGRGPWIRTVVDRSGRAAQVAIDAKVDTVAPPQPAVSTPVDGTAYEIGVGATVSLRCPDDATSGVNLCEARYGTGVATGNGMALDVGEVGNPGTLGARQIRVVSQDRAGNQNSRTVNYTVVDTTAPTVPPLASPARDAVTSNRTPTFSWGSSADAGVGMKEYRINIGGKTYTLPASAALQAGFTIPDELVDGTYEWQVFAVDQAGNSSASPKRRFRIDPAAGGAPVISAGPSGGGATANRTPTFAFTGVAGSTFSWRTLDANDTEIPGGSGSGQGPVTLPALADGTYSFSVSQTLPDGRQSDAAVALFRVDTVAPAAPRVTAAPTSTNDRQPSFAWAAAEVGGSFTWQVVNPAGVGVQGPNTTTDTSVRLPTPLGPGAYVFRVQQRDVAGNPGAWATASFNVVGPPIAPSTTSTKRTASALARPATRFPNRLRPKAGARLNHRRVILRWKRVRSAPLYNVQVFRLQGKRYKKVFTAFPRTNRVRVPLKRMKPGQRYMWRVWPYMAKSKRFTKRPFGISWFDTRKVVRKKVVKKTTTVKKAAVLTGSTLVIGRIGR